MTELLSPAGSFEAFMEALYNGADAIYLATENYGARAYAKNLTLDELKRALAFAHSKNVKIYVTVNTIIKENELKDAKLYLNKLYEMGVDGVIVADIALIDYVNTYLKPMECHISTQVGIKNINDIRFFEGLGVDRCVIARETSIDKIREIKKLSKMPIEVFSYGALCVSYSGGCLFSSLLSLRSGNRGRCAQNCRREYKLFKNDKLMDKGFMLSMKDLNTYPKLDELIDIKVDSLKIEGRMKSPEYVKLVTSTFRDKIDKKNTKSNPLDTVFHRAYTKGFLFNEDKGSIVDINKKSNEGALIGKVIGFKDNLTKIHLDRALNVKDRIRIEGEKEYYFTIDKIYNSNLKEVQTGSGDIYLDIYDKRNVGDAIYKMVDSSISLEIDSSKKEPLDLMLSGSIGDYPILATTYNNKYYEIKGSFKIERAKTQGIDFNTLYRQLSKLNDTPFYLSNLDDYLEDNSFMTISSINELRRNLIAEIMDDLEGKRELKEIALDSTSFDYDNELKLAAFCVREDQYKACKDLGITEIYYKNYSAYVDSKYNDIDEDYVLVGSYDGIYHYKNKKIISDYSFNVINSESIYNLHKYGVERVTISVETDYDLLTNIYNEYFKKYKVNPNLEMICYGKENLMTTKYCPLRRYGECSKCNDNKYHLEDDLGKFEIYHDGCITHIINSKPLNLVDDLDKIKKYVNVIRLNFTNESYDETVRIITDYKDKLDGSKEKKFDSKNQTHGHFKRPII